MSASRVMDVSQFNGTVNWSKVKGNVDAAIVRAGYRGYGAAGTLREDSRFAGNLSGAAAAGVPIGVYWVTQAVTETEAAEEADFVHKLVGGPAKLSLPVFLDSEYSGADNHSGRADGHDAKARTDCALAFLARIQALGYQAGVYASESWFSSKLEFDRLTGCSIWVAKYNAKKPSTARYDGWQYTSAGSVPGVTGKVDLSYFYRAFSARYDGTGNTLAKNGKNTAMLRDESRKGGVTLTVNANGGLQLRRTPPASLSRTDLAKSPILTTLANGSTIAWYGYYCYKDSVKWLYVRTPAGVQGYAWEEKLQEAGL